MGFFYHSASLFVDDFHQILIIIIMSEEEFLKIQTCVLKVNIHCDGCKQKVRKVLTNIKGVHGVKIESEQGKVLVSGNVDKQILLKKLSKSRKHAEIWGVSQKQVQMNDLSKNMQIDGGKSGGGGGEGGKDGQNSVKFDVSESDDDEDDDEFDEDDNSSKKPDGGGSQKGNMMKNPQFMKGGGGRGNMNGGNENHGGGGCQSHNNYSGGRSDMNGGVQRMQNMMSMRGGGRGGMGLMGHMSAVEELQARGPMGGNNGYFHGVGPEAMAENPYYQQQSGECGNMNGGNQIYGGGGGCQSHNKYGGGRGDMNGGVHGMQNMMSMRGGGGGGGGMGLMRHMGVVEGLPPGGPMGGNNVYFHGAMAGNPYYQQQSVAAMMNQQQTTNGNQRFQPMMYASKPPEVNYLPQPFQPSYPSYHYPQPPHGDPLTHYFSDENTSSSCNIM